jgi:hypothetical protein
MYRIMLIALGAIYVVGGYRLTRGAFNSKNIFEMSFAGILGALVGLWLIYMAFVGDLQ